MSQWFIMISYEIKGHNNQVSKLILSSFKKSQIRLKTPKSGNDPPPPSTIRNRRVHEIEQKQIQMPSLNLWNRRAKGQNDI